MLLRTPRRGLAVAALCSLHGGCQAKRLREACVASLPKMDIERNDVRNSHKLVAKVTNEAQLIPTAIDEGQPRWCGTALALVDHMNA